MKAVGTIWWDFDGTLISRPFMWSEACCRCLENIAPEQCVSQQQLKLALKQRFPWQRLDHAQLTQSQWWSEVYRVFREALDGLGCTVPEGCDLDSAIRADILNSRRYALFDDVVPVLELLGREGWRHLVVSNHVPELAAVVDGLGIGRFFHAVITSGIVGYEKPHPKMFEAAVQQSVAEAPLWMIGDNAAVDCEASMHHGAKAILVRAGNGTFEPYAANLWRVVDIIQQS
jgi:putative hydrolase of the HAD superfamily